MKENLTAGQFLGIMINGYAYIENQKSDFNRTNSLIEIENIKVSEPVSLSHGGTFQKPTLISDSEFEQLSFNSSSHTFDLRFRNCSFNQKVYVSSSFSTRLSFENCTFHSELTFSVSRIKTLHLEKCTANDLITCEGGIEDLILRGNKFKSISLNLNSGRLDSIQDEIENLLVEHGTYKKFKLTRLNINSIKIKNGLFPFIEMEAIELNESFVLSNGEIDKANIRFLTGTGAFFIENTNIKYFKIETSFFDHLSINKNIEKDCSYSIEKSQIREIYFTDFKNNGVLRFAEVEIPGGGILALINCDLGKTSFLKCNFNDCDFEFENSKVPEVFLAETDFPKKIVVGRKVNYQQAQLVFGQLQNTYQKQGDSIRANEYLAREIESYYYTLNWFEKRFFKIGKLSIAIPFWLSSNFFTKVSLSLNKISNDFGRNWFRGVVFTLSIGFLFFFFLLISSKEYHFSFFPSLEFKWTKSFLKFMNPLRHFETQNLFEENDTISLSTNSYIIDYLARVFIAYGFYQTIQAFRRYGRK